MTSPAKEKRIEELERKVEEPDFWNDPEESQTDYERTEGSERTYREDHARFIPDMKMWRFFWKWDMKKRIHSVVTEIEEELEEVRESCLKNLRIQTLLSE